MVPLKPQNFASEGEAFRGVYPMYFVFSFPATSSSRVFYRTLSKFARIWKTSPLLIMNSNFIYNNIEISYKRQLSLAHKSTYYKYISKQSLLFET